jgi:hypothetical protein
MSTWDAARLASRRPLPKRVSFIGRDPTISDLSPRQKSAASGGYSPSDKACFMCGYHVCSCPPKFGIDAATMKLWN